MLTPISPTSANSLASSPGWSGTETNTEAVASAGPPCLPGIARVPLTPRTRISASESSSPAASTSTSRLRSVCTSRSSSLTAAWLARMIWPHITGSPAAIRVTSRTP